MLFSKGNLIVRKIASKEVSDRSLNCVHFAEDGATVASNGKCLMAVGAVDSERMHFPDVGGDADVIMNGISVGLDIVDQTLKNLPKDKRVSMQNVMMTRCDSSLVEFTCVDMNKEQRVAGKPVGERFPEWINILRGAKKKATLGKICVNRKDLIALLEAMDAAGDSGDEGAVFIEFGEEDDAVMLRNVNHKTGQTVIGMVMPLYTGGNWIKNDAWSRKVFGVSAKRRL